MGSGRTEFITRFVSNFYVHTRIVVIHFSWYCKAPRTAIKIEFIIIIIIIIIISTFITVSTGVLYVYQLGANHAPRASVTQVNLSVQILSTFLRIRVDPNMQIFWISVTLALLDTFSMFSIIPFFSVPSAPTTTNYWTRMSKVSWLRAIYFFGIKLPVQITCIRNVSAW